MSQTKRLLSGVLFCLALWGARALAQSFPNQTVYAGAATLDAGPLTCEIPVLVQDPCYNGLASCINTVNWTWLDSHLMMHNPVPGIAWCNVASSAYPFDGGACVWEVLPNNSTNLRFGWEPKNEIGYSPACDMDIFNGNFSCVGTLSGWTSNISTTATAATDISSTDITNVSVADAGYYSTMTVWNGQNVIPANATVFYVSTTGSDSNDCRSSAHACATIQAAVNKVPKLVRAPYLILVGAGHFPVGAYVDGFTMDMGNYTASADAGPYLAIEGTLATASLGGTMSGTIASATDGIGPNNGASGPANWSTATVTGAGWTTNALAGSLFCLTSGRDSPSCSMVYQNTATVVTSAGVWMINTPQAGDSFAIETQATEIDGGLPRPPGGAALQGYSGPTNFPAAFFVANNNAAGWASGFSIGFGNDTGIWNSTAPFGAQTPFANASFIEPQISISNFRFDNADYLVDVGASGANELLNFSNNSTYTGIAVSSFNGASFDAINNYGTEDVFGNTIFQNSATAVGSPASSVILYGNYMYLARSVGDGEETESGLDCGGWCVAAQNVFLEANYTSDGGWLRGTQDGICDNTSAVTTSIGNEYQGLLIPLTDVWGATRYQFVTDADDFNNNAFVSYLNFQSLISLGADPPTWNDNFGGFCITTGSTLNLNSNNIAGIADGGDIILEYYYDFSYPYLVTDGGIYTTMPVNDGPLGATRIYDSPGALVNLNRGTAAYFDGIQR